MSNKLIAIVLLLGVALSAGAQELGWPQEIVTQNQETITVYQPQVEEFTGIFLAGRAAVSVKAPATNDAPVFGAIWFEARIDTDRDARTAVIRDVDILDVRFADASDEQMQKLADLIESRIEQSRFTISVDQLLADLDASEAGAGEPELRHEPPKLILSTEPALLVSMDGKPVFEAIERSNYERVVNTPFLIVKDGRTHYLYIGSNAWYTATAIDGPWDRTEQVPQDIAGLVEPSDDDDTLVDDVRIIVATEPTELIVSDGDPTWSPVEGMNLLYLDNTDSDVFVELSTQSYYVLLSGRWYRGTGMLGDISWRHVPNDELPAPFGDIPEEAVNAGRDGAVIVENVRRQQKEQDDLAVGYDVLRDTYVNMVTQGIIDPVKVTRSAVENAGSIGAMILTTEALISDIPEDEPAPAAPPMPQY